MLCAAEAPKVNQRMKHFITFLITILITYSCAIKQAPTNSQIDNSKITSSKSEAKNEIKTTYKTKVDLKNERKFNKISNSKEKTEKLHDSVYFFKIASHDKWQELLQKYVSSDGNVDYIGFQKNKKDLKEYINQLSKNLPTVEWLKAQKLAYWINAYNALTIDLILRHYPTKSIKDIKDPWDQRLWQFGDKWQNLNDIEHKILRKMNEPRIHFAIVCASISCPKLQNKAFTASNLEAQLTNATKEFIADTTKNEISKDKIKLSKIFKWFKKDFEENGSLIDFLNQYSDVAISNNAKKSYTDYNWDLND